MTDIDVALFALGDPTRRCVIERLANGPARTNELARAVGVSVPAVSRHLRVLRENGLVERSDVDGDGRGREYRLELAGLSVVADWIESDRWATRLASRSSDPIAAEYLARVGAFLDAFAASDADYFERHLSPDAELVFPGAATRWDRDSTVASVADHAPYTEWKVSDSTVRSLGGDITLVVVKVAVRTATSHATESVVQSMIFDDSGDPWQLRFLQQTKDAA